VSNVRFSHWRASSSNSTSLPPKIERLAGGRKLGAMYQRECIASWRRLGFDVVSLNSRAEIEALLPLGYEVTFKEVAASPPQINDFLAVIKEELAAVAGIICRLHDCCQRPGNFARS
jgi:hypothetical protein